MGWLKRSRMFRSICVVLASHKQHVPSYQRFILSRGCASRRIELVVAIYLVLNLQTRASEISRNCDSTALYTSIAQERSIVVLLAGLIVRSRLPETGGGISVVIFSLDTKELAMWEFDN